MIKLPIRVGSDLAERAYLAGADWQKISAALVRGKAEGMDVSFQDLVETDLRDHSPG